MWFLFVTNIDDFKVLMRKRIQNQNFHIEYLLLSLFLTQQLNNWNISSVQNQTILVLHRKFEIYLIIFSPSEKLFVALL